LRILHSAIRNPQCAFSAIAFLIGYKSFALSRISIISDIFHSTPGPQGTV
jgi:hypothetical protein